MLIVDHGEKQGGHALYHLADHLIGDYHMDFEGWKKAINS